MKSRRNILVIAAICILIICGATYYYFFSSMSAKDTAEYVYIDADDDLDSVTVKLEKVAKPHAISAFRLLARNSSYAANIRTGRYAVEPGEGAAVIFRRLKNGMQTPVNLTIPSVRTVERLSAILLLQRSI